MQTVVRLEGAVEQILETLVEAGYYKTKSEAIRAGILELGKEYSIMHEETRLVSKRIAEMKAEVKAGKKKMIPIEKVAEEEGVEI